MNDINKNLSDIKDNVDLFSNLKNFSYDDNVKTERKKKIAIKNINNMAFSNSQNQEHNIHLTKSISVKHFHLDINNSSTTSPFEQRIELDQHALDKIDYKKLQNEIMSISTTLNHINEEICNLRKQIYKIHSVQGMNNKTGKYNSKKCKILFNNTDEKENVIKQEQSNLKPSGCTETISFLETNLINTINSVEKHLQSIEEYVLGSLKNMNDISQNKNETIQLDFESIKKDLLELKHNKIVKEKQNEIVIEEKLDLLKIIKANKEEVEETLADKPDIYALNKKVSHSQFNAVCDDFVRTLNEAITKLSQQESLCQQSIYELRCEFEGKLDELEIPTLKDFIKNELQALKNQIRLLSDIKQEQEAAGAKKFLRNLRCISCDKNAFMETNLKIITNAQPFPCRPSVKPYFTFKMDHIRDKKIRQRKKCINLEKVMSANTEKYKYGLIEIMPKNYFCNRYSGGNHTIVSPQRRVTLQKATKYFGMCSDVNVQTIEGVVEGTDGRIYRGRWFIE